LTAPTSQPQVSVDAPATSSAAVSIGAAIDIGSNSVHLLVALVGPGWVEPLRDASELLGLGDVVDRHGGIPAEDRRRVIDALTAFRDTADRSHAERVTLLGTEPLRRASNSQELLAEIREAMGLDVRILSEREEALLTLVGVTRGEKPGHPMIVVDIGGGSTEASTYVPGEPVHVDHIPVGSARLTNAIVEHDPPTDDEVSRLAAAAAEATAGLRYVGANDTHAVRPNDLQAVFVGGTATNVARLGQLTRAAMARDRRTLERLSVAAVAARYNVRPRRAGQLAAGVAIVDALLERLGLETAEVSDASLRDGAIICASRYGDRWPDALQEFP
jgi:exopolyphosphatase/pppGpp-phosphohydrolase